MSDIEIVVAAETQNEELLRQLLAERPHAINGRGYKDNTVLFFSAEWGFLEMVNVIIEAGASLEIKNEDGDTALIAASRKGNYDICAKLIESGCEIDVQNKEGLSALMEACRYGQQYVVQLLVAAGADFELMDKRGLCAIIHASLWGHRHIINDLVASGAKLNNRHYLPVAFQGNKVEAKIKLKQQALSRKMTEEERRKRQRDLVLKLST